MRVREEEKTQQNFSFDSHVQNLHFAELAPQSKKEDIMIISEERCLQRYFEAEVVFSNHISSEERRRLFGAYADVYGIDVARADELSRRIPRSRAFTAILRSNSKRGYSNSPRNTATATCLPTTCRRRSA